MNKNGEEFVHTHLLRLRILVSRAGRLRWAREGDFWKIRRRWNSGLGEAPAFW
jgi:hypothetical protein